MEIMIGSPKDKCALCGNLFEEVSDDYEGESF